MTRNRHDGAYGAALVINRNFCRSGHGGHSHSEPGPDTAAVPAALGGDGTAGNASAPAPTLQPCAVNPLAVQGPAVVDDLLEQPMHTDSLTASLPMWLFRRSVMARFQKANADVWSPPPPPKPLPADLEPARLAGSLPLSRSLNDEENYAYNNFFYGRGGGTFLEMGTSTPTQPSVMVCVENLHVW